MIKSPKFNRRSVLALGAGATFAAGLPLAAQAKTSLRYGHNNEPASVAGAQAQWFADALAEISNNDLQVTVFPAGHLGKLQEMAEAVSLGTIAFSHNTAGGIGSLYAPFGALDTPYLYRSVEHLMNVTDVTSPVMQMLNKGLIEAAGVRVIYAHYFGKRNLTCNTEIRTPSDLAGVKIRAVPFPMYTTAVEGMGAVAVPVDWSEVPTALATGVVQGQENPVNVVLKVKLYEIRKYLMLTGHMTNAEMVVMNEKDWQSMSAAQQANIMEAAQQTRNKATSAILDNEEAETQQLRDLGMTVVSEKDGLDVPAFRASVGALVKERFGEQFGQIYDMIDQIPG